MPVSSRALKGSSVQLLYSRDGSVSAFSPSARCQQIIVKNTPALDFALRIIHARAVEFLNNAVPDPLDVAVANFGDRSDG